MTVTIKALAERDFFAWYELFVPYASSAGLQVNDEQVMRVWTALQGDSAHAVLAAMSDGRTVGFAHFSEFERLLQGDRGYVIEDLYVAEDARRNGVATALVEHIRTRAEEESRSTVRCVSRVNDPAATALYDKFAAATGDWLLHDLTV